MFVTFAVYTVTPLYGSVSAIVLKYGKYFTHQPPPPPPQSSLLSPHPPPPSPPLPPLSLVIMDEAEHFGNYSEQCAEM